MTFHANRKAEEDVLGALLLRNEAYRQIAHVLQPEHFAVDGHGAIWTTAAGLIAAGKVADPESVAGELDSRGIDAGGYAYLIGLASEAYGSRNTAQLAATIVETYRRRVMVETADAARDIADGDDNADVMLDRITTLFDGLARASVVKGPRTFADIAVERIAHYAALVEGTAVAGWRTHIPWLTAALGGGICPGGLYVLAARPSVGKSSFAQSLGQGFAADGLTTLFLSQEMEDTELFDRGVSNAGPLSYSALRSGDMQQEHLTIAITASDKLGRLPFLIDDTPGLTLKAIRFKAKSVKGLKVLILDYLQLCDYEMTRGTSTNDALATVSKGLKALAKELGIAIIALSQLNRDVEKRGNKRPISSDLRDSGAIEQDADVILFLWPVREVSDRRIIGLAIDKNRQGRRGGQIGLDFFGDTQRWQQSDADIDNEPAWKGRKGDFE